MICRPTPPELAAVLRRLDIAAVKLIAPETAVLGSEYFAFRGLETNLPLLRANRAYLDPVITHRSGVGEIQHALKLFFAGQTGKVIIEQ